jgi:hypothetical protein
MRRYLCRKNWFCYFRETKKLLVKDFFSGRETLQIFFDQSLVKFDQRAVSAHISTIVASPFIFLGAAHNFLLLWQLHIRHILIPVRIPHRVIGLCHVALEPWLRLRVFTIKTIHPIVTSDFQQQPLDFQLTALTGLRPRQMLVQKLRILDFLLHQNAAALRRIPPAFTKYRHPLFRHGIHRNDTSHKTHEKERPTQLTFGFKNLKQCVPIENNISDGLSVYKWVAQGLFRSVPLFRVFF